MTRKLGPRILSTLTVMLAAASWALPGPSEKKVEKVESKVTAEEIALDQQTLDQLKTSGSDLSKPHQIEFYLYVPSKAGAEASAAFLSRQGYLATVRLGADDVNWLCRAAKTMVPIIERMTEARKLFKSLAAKHKGEYDGWEAAVEK